MNALKRYWINVHGGALDYLMIDTSSNFITEEMKDAASRMGITVKSVPTEAHNRIGKVERSQSVLRSIYEKLKIYFPCLHREERLSLTFRAANDAPSSESGTSPTMLVFSVLPKLPGAGHRGAIAERANIIREFTRKDIQMNAKRVVRDSIRSRNKISRKDIEEVKRTVPGSRVLVYREDKILLPYAFVRVRESEVHDILRSGTMSSFAINMVRPYRTSNGKDEKTTAICKKLSG